MFKTIARGAVLLGVSAAVLLTGCSSSNNSTGSGGGGGGGREMVSGDIAGNGGAFTHVFTAAKVVAYYCRYHGGPGGVGMSGVITVTQSAGAPTRHTFTITAMTLPTMTINVGDTMTWTNTSGIVHTVESDH